MKKRGALLLVLLFFFLSLPAFAGQNTYTGHDGVSIASAISINETRAMRFGNFAVSSPGGGDASIVLGIDDSRTRFNGASTTITLLNGGNTDAGSQGAGFYSITGGGNGTQIYIAFVDHAGTAISAGNPVLLTGPPGSSEFKVDSFTFNSSGSDGGGDYITTDAGGNATVRVGATLHTKAGATTYAPGTYRGTFQIMASY